MAAPILSEPQAILNRIPDFVNAFKTKREDKQAEILNQLVPAPVPAGHEYGETYAASILSQVFLLNIASSGFYKLKEATVSIEGMEDKTNAATHIVSLHNYISLMCDCVEPTIWTPVA